MEQKICQNTSPYETYSLDQRDVTTVSHTEDSENAPCLTTHKQQMSI